ncbi:MAG: tyrosine-type recombinase/integrase [bacterium]
MGSLRKIGKNYQIDVCRKGIRVRKIVGPSKRLALEVLADIEGRLVRGEYGLDRNDSLISDVFVQFASFAKMNMACASSQRYQNVIDRFQEFLVTEPRIRLCSQVNLGVIERYRQSRLAGTQPPMTKSMNFEIKTLRTIFNYAIKWDLAEKNPTDGIRFQRVMDAKPHRILTKDEVSVLLDASPPDMRSVILGFLHSGMRRGELEHLTWQDVDFEKEVIYIRHKDDWKPKTGERDIAMSPELKHVLRSLCVNRGDEHPYVFTLEGRPTFHGEIRKRLILIARRAGIANLTSVHSLRHTFGSFLVDSGVPLPVVKELLGHSDIRMTMTYVHTTQDAHRRAVENLNYLSESD